MRSLLVAGLVSLLLVPAAARAEEEGPHETTVMFNPFLLVVKTLQVDVEHALGERLSVGATATGALPGTGIPVTLGAEALWRVWGEDFDGGLRFGLEPAIALGGPAQGSFFVDSQGLHLWALASFKTTMKFGLVGKVDAGPELVARGPEGTVVFHSFTARLLLGWGF